jgi:hypothetical protein
VSEQDDLIGDMIAEVACSQGVAISRDDPVVAVVLLNQVVLRRYPEETITPAAAAIRDATREALGQIARLAEAQAHWLEQVSLKDRASFLEDQKGLHDAWKADMEAPIEGQNTALRQVVLQTVTLLRNQAPAAGLVLATPPAALQAQRDGQPLGPDLGWDAAGNGGYRGPDAGRGVRTSVHRPVGKGARSAIRAPSLGPCRPSGTLRSHPWVAGRRREIEPSGPPGWDLAAPPTPPTSTN